MTFLLVWLLAGILEVPFAVGEQPRWRIGRSYPRPLPQEIMVDAVNYIGLVLLHAHNQNNENNIALSPYGATSVLVALGEGVQGTALDEILRATLLPLDVSVTRVGLRDIHRHLKSYFIPQEGFLAGLTFSHENVTLKASYEDILRFYGYDVDSFNNALYPDPYSSTTTASSESSTESLNSDSEAANFSGNTAHTAPSTTAMPATLENKDQFNLESSTAQTTQLLTNPTTLTGEVAPENTITSSVATTRPDTTAAATVQTSTDTTFPLLLIDTTTTQTTTTATPETTIPDTVTTTTPITEAAITAQTTTTTSVSTEEVATTTSVTTSGATTSAAQTTTVIATTAQITTVSSSTTSHTTTPTTADTAITTSQGSTSSSPTSGPTILFVATPETNAATTLVPVANTVTQTTVVPTLSTGTATTTPPVTNIATPSTRPTSVTISVVPSTLGIGKTDSTTTSVTTDASTQIQDTGPIIVNLQPTTIASASTDTVSTTATEPVSTFITAPSTLLLQTESSTAEATISPIVTVTATDTESTTLNSDPAPSPLTIDLVPSTVGTGSTGNSSSGTTDNYVPSLITPLGDLSRGIAIDVMPSTVAPRSASILAENTENGKSRRMVTSETPKWNSLPRFRNDIELIESLKFDNKSAAVQQENKNSLVSLQSTSTNSLGTIQNITVSKNIKDLVINASNGRITTSSVTAESAKNTMNNSIELQNAEEEVQAGAASTAVFMASTIDYSDYSENSTLTKENEKNSSSTTQMDSTSETVIAFDDEDVIIVNRETDFVQSREIALSGEEMFLEPNTFGERSVLTESNNEEQKTRGTRSVIDYLIARYHDNNPQYTYVTTGTEHEPAKPTTFAVNGKIREPNISFMTYDTVLPFRYISYLNALALTFPLDSTKYYLLLILPVDEMGIDNLIANMMSTTLKQIIYHLQPTRVKATIPSFMLKGYVVLTTTLQKLGIRQIFEPRHADFSRMTDDKDIYVTNIEQAVTVTIRNYVDPNTLQINDHFQRRGPVQFTADHPFLYFVMDSQIHVALMAGKIINPLNSRIK